MSFEHCAYQLELAQLDDVVEDQSHPFARIPTHEPIIMLLSQATDIDEEEPKTFAQAMNGVDSGEWKAAMEDEYQSLIENHTWKVVDNPSDRTVLRDKFGI